MLAGGQSYILQHPFSVPESYRCQAMRWIKAARVYTCNETRFILAAEILTLIEQWDFFVLWTVATSLEVLGTLGMVLQCGIMS